MVASNISNNRISTGVEGLDEILQGGLISERAYLVRGGPGAGKTTLGLHFLMAGAANNEKALFINMGESETQIRLNAAQIGLNIEPVLFLDLSPTPDFFKEVQTYDLFSPAEVELEPTTNKIISQIEALKPQRVFLDAMTHFRYFSSDEFQFRKQIHSFLRFLIENGATVLFTSEENRVGQDDDLQFISDGIIHLENIDGYRTVNVIKLRGSGFRSGRHSLRLTDDGMLVFPALLPERYSSNFQFDILSSGIPELDELLHGGLQRSMTTIITGPSGVGKTTLAMSFMKEAAGRGERAAIYTFEEWRETLILRCEAVNIPIKAMIDQGTMMVTQVDPIQYTANQFANIIRRDVEEYQTKIVMIDSIAGYRLSLSGGGDLISHLHGLCKYLQSKGVTVILINEIEAITGDFKVTEMGISYLADNIIFMRYIEIDGEMRRMVGVLKKRLSDFEKTMREFQITRYGIKVGQPLNNLQGVLTGTPEKKAQSKV